MLYQILPECVAAAKDDEYYQFGNGVSSVMQSAKQTITFRTKAETLDRLDKVADAMGCDRSHVLNQAIETYLETDGWQIQHIVKGQKQARNGEFVPEPEWRSTFSRNR